MADLELLMKPLKRQRLGPPEWYPQDVKQSEDELSDHNVKKGFLNQPVVSNEHGSAKELFNSVPLSKFASHFNVIQLQKHKINLFQDGSKKKPAINIKDNFWPVTARSKAQVTAWLQDLAGTKSLSILGRKVPIFNKKEEIFSCLCEHAVPLVRATWFLKITSAYQNAIIEGKMKKRLSGDPSQEWTQALTKFLKDQLTKLTDFCSQPYSSLSYHRLPPEVETVSRQWEYGIRLSHWLLEESLLDKQDFFHWTVELIERMKSNDDVLLKYVIPLVLKHIEVILQTQTLSRMLATYCIRKLISLNNVAEQMHVEKQDLNTPNSSELQGDHGLSRCTSPMLPLLTEFGECHQHKSLVVAMCGIIQAVTFKCPSALVWSVAKITGTPNSQSTETRTPFLGSPLDRLPCAPSDLVHCFQTGRTEEQDDLVELQRALVKKEIEIKRRGQAMERRWLSPAHQETKFVNKRLAYLEVLDQANFGVTFSGSNFDPLYSKLFRDPNKQFSEEAVTEERSAISTLLDWAVSKYRHGKHRALVAAKLLHKRHTHLWEETVKMRAEDPESRENGESSVCPFPLQEILFEFLDLKAPLPGLCPQDDVSFWQLVLIFGELIRHGVFSSDDYICKLIARGNLGGKMAEEKTLKVLSVGKLWHEVDHHGKRVPKKRTRNPSLGDHDYQNRNELELDKELMHHQEQLQQLLDHDISPLDHVGPSAIFGFPSLKGASQQFESSISSVVHSNSCLELVEKRTEVHLYYLAQFPMPQDGDESHDNNQRLLALFGVGRMLQEHKKKVLEVQESVLSVLNEADELGHLYSEFSAKLGKEEQEQKVTYEQRRMKMLRDYASIPSHEQYQIITEVMEIFNMLKCSRPAEYGVCAPLPSLFRLSLLLDLFELSGDVQGLLNFIGGFVARREVCYSGGVVPQTSIVKSTQPTKLILIVSAIRQQYACVLADVELTCIVFRGLLQTVENIADPGTCTSTERCVLSLLHDLYTSCEHLRIRYSDIFSTAYTKIKQAICPGLKPSNTSLLWDQAFLSEYFSPQRKLQLEPLWTRHLSDDRPGDIYSFVCSAVHNLVTTNDMERLYDLAVLCAEVTAHITALSSEWLGVLKSLCCSADPGLGFNDLLGNVDIMSNMVYESLPVFVAILMGRACFTLEDFLRCVAIPSLESAIPPGANWEEACPGAKVTCHILVKVLDESMDLFSSPHGCISRAPFKATPDHGLLYGYYSQTPFSLIIQTMKHLLLLSDSGNVNNSDNLNDDLVGDAVFQSLFNIGNAEILESTSSNSELFGASLGSGTQKSSCSDSSAPLHSISGHLLQLLCTQNWIKQRFPLESINLLTRDLLLDAKLTLKQAKCLIKLCTVTESQELCTLSEESDFDSASDQIIQNLNHWSLHTALLELQLMAQHTNTENVSLLFDSIAKSVMAALIYEDRLDGDTEDDVGDSCRHTLIGPLIAKLPSQIQGRILKAAAEIMERGKWWMDTDNTRLSAASQKTLFNLILSCLKGQDENKHIFLDSLQKQLAKLAAAPEEEKFPSNVVAKQFLLNSLNLRLNLVGAVFDDIQSSPKTICDWSVTLFQLLTSGVVTEDVSAPYECMFTDLYDMTSVLLTSIHLSEIAQSAQPSHAGDLHRYNQLTQRLWRELSNKGSSETIVLCKQLLPLNSSLPDILTMEPIQSSSPGNTASSTPLNKSNSDGETEAEQGLKVQGHQFASPWELLEDHRSPAPMAWAWFGAVRMERRPLRYFEQARRLLHHTHQKRMLAPSVADSEQNKSEEDVTDEVQDDTSQSRSKGAKISCGQGGGSIGRSETTDINRVIASSQASNINHQQQQAKQQQPQQQQSQQQQLLQQQQQQNQDSQPMQQPPPHSQHKVQQGAPQGAPKRGRGRGQRHTFADGTTGTSLTPTQQKKMQFLLQQQQQQQDSTKVYGAKPMSTRTPTSSFASGPDTTKAALHSMIAAKNQTSLPADPMSVHGVHSQQSLAPLTEQLLRQKQQQQQQHATPDLFSLTAQEQQLLGQGPPPNVQMPLSQPTPMSASAVAPQSSLMFSTGQRSMSDYSGAQLSSQQHLSSQQMLHPQYPPRTQITAGDQLLMPNQQHQPQTTLHQLLRNRTPRGQVPTEQQLIQQRLQQRRPQLQQQQQQQQQGLTPGQLSTRTATQQALLVRHMQRVKDQQMPRGLQPMQRQLSATDIGIQQQMQAEMPMYQRQVSVPQNELQQLQGSLAGNLGGMMPSTSQFSVANTNQYPPPGQY